MPNSGKDDWKLTVNQWRSQGGAHWGTCPTDLAGLVPHQDVSYQEFKDIVTITLFKQRISYILTYLSHT